MSPVSSDFNIFCWYRVSFCLTYCNWCHLTDQIWSMMSLTMMGLIPVPLVHALLLFVLMVPLFMLETPLDLLENPSVVSVAWGLAFFPDRNRVNWWQCSVGNVRTKGSWVQRRLTHRNILAPKILVFPPSLKISFVTIVLFWPRPAHSNRCNFSKNMTQRRKFGSIRRPSKSGRRVSKGPEYIRCVDGREPQIYEVWCFGSDSITPEVHPIAQVDVGAGVVGQLLSDYHTTNGRRISILGQISINGSVEYLGIPDFHITGGTMWVDNIMW